MWGEEVGDDAGIFIYFEARYQRWRLITRVGNGSYKFHNLFSRTQRLKERGVDFDCGPKGVSDAKHR